MGKTVKTVLKIAAGAAIATFAPMLAPALLAAVGAAGASALAVTVTSAAIGAAAGEAAGIGWKAGATAGALGGAESSNLFGGTAAAGGGTAAGAAPEAAAALTPTVQAGVTTPALTSTGGAIGSGTGLSTASSAAPAAAGTAGTAGTAAGTAGTAGTAGAAAPATLGGTLSAVASQAGKVGLAGLKAVAPQVAAAMLTGTPGAALARAQQEELARAQQANASLVQARLSEAQKLIGDAAYFDPEYMGRQAAEAAMIRGGLQAAEETRGLTGSRLDAERRRFKLGTARTAGTAYQQGQVAGAEARTKTRAAGIGAMPTEYPTTNPAGALYANMAARTARDTETEKLGALFAQALGRDKAKSAGLRKPEEEEAI